MAAPEEHTIQEVFVTGDPWDSNKNMRTDEILFEGDARTYRVFRPAGDPESKPGEKLNGWKNDDGKFNIAKDDFKGKGGGGKGYGPEDIARISRSHAQEMALRLVAATGNARELELSNKADAGTYLNEVLAPLADWFDRDVQKAAEAVKAKGAESNGSGDAEAVPAATKADESIPF